MELKRWGMIMSEHWGSENLLRRESGGIKVGFVVQKLHGPENLKMKNFGELRSLRALVQNFLALPGAAR